MSARFDLEAYDEQPFYFEEEEEFRPRRQRAPASRKPFAAGGTRGRHAPGKKRPRPGRKFPFRFPISPLPVAVWPGLLREPAKEPQAYEPVQNTASSGLPSQPPGSDQGREGSEYIRWVQTSLNKVLNLNLPVDGVMDAKTREAISSFQRRKKLPVTGVVGPDTEKVLVAAMRSSSNSEATTMNRQSYFKSEPFEFYPGLAFEQVGGKGEPESFGFEWDSEEWEEEVKRGSPEHAAWAQHSLNQIKGLRLAVDGVIGAATRSAIRSFQQQSGLTVDGVVGAQTEGKIVQALKQLLMSGQQAVCAAIRQPESLDRFDFDGDKVKPHHQPQISQIAQCVVASQGALKPIHAIRLIGHTDPVGSDAYNLDLARRRANQVKRSLTDNIDLLSPGLSGKISFTVETRGESQPITGDAPRSRRVEVFVPLKVTPPPQKGCPPFKARIRLHAKILQTPDVPVATMVSSMQQIFGPAGFLVELASTENLNLPTLADLDLHCPGQPTSVCCPFPCASASLNPEVVSLFQNRNNVGVNEIVVYFVRTTDPPLAGCCAHPIGRPGAVVVQSASQWVLSHEVGHVLGLTHVPNNSDRLMFPVDAFTNPPPDIVVSEIKTIDQSLLTVDC